MKIHLKILKFAAILAVMTCSILPLRAAGTESLDFLRSTGKIYAVVAVIVIIFIGIVIFLFRLDNKLTKLENQIKNEQ